jgi:DNA-binding XRE family transcriptional regulator
MRSAVVDVLPASLRRSLKKLGEDLSIARRRRSLTTAMMAERVGVGVGTYRRAERGDPKVSMGVYAMAMFVLGFGDALALVIDPARDEQGLVLETSRLPKRVRIKKDPTAS